MIHGWFTRHQICTVETYPNTFNHIQLLAAKIV